MKIDGVLIDLDGTLVDTAPDLVGVLNTLLREEGLRTVPYALARNVVSNGSIGLLRLGLGLAPDAEVDAAVRRRFLDLYAERVCDNSRIFIDIEQFINLTYKNGMRWGIVTNKPAALTRALLERLRIADRFGSVVSGDTLPERKPHPAPLELAARELGLDPGRCVYIGDAPRDIEAGRAAGMRTIAAAYGYIRARDDPYRWHADAVLAHPRELAGILDALVTAGGNR